MHKSISLDQNNFKLFFSPVGPLHSHHEHIWPYDYVDRNSDTLLVTIGDSWTWGSGLNACINADAVSITAEQNKARQDTLYGNLIAREKNYNWLNLGFYAMGNQWIAHKVLELIGLVQRLEFKKIIVICVLTGTARCFNTFHDAHINHHAYFQSNPMKKVQEFENFLIDLNRKIIEQIAHTTNGDERVQLLVGTNAVDHCGFDYLRRDQIIPLPWYRLLTDTLSDKVYVDIESVKCLQSIEDYLQEDEQKIAFKHWMMQKIDQAEKQNDVIRAMTDVSQDLAHPNDNGHRKWADYILQEIL